MATAGIDPGKKGGICIIDGSPEFYPMPICKTGKGSKTELDLPRINGIFTDLQLRFYQLNFLVILEKQQAYPNQGAVSNFTTGGGFWALRAMLVAHDLPHVIITPQTWQKAVGIVRGPDNDTKKQSVAIAERMFPGVDLRATSRCTTKSDGLSDALLMAIYGRQIMGDPKGGTY